MSTRPFLKFLAFFGASAIVGLAAAFIAVMVRPELITRRMPPAPAPAPAPQPSPAREAPPQATPASLTLPPAIATPPRTVNSYAEAVERAAPAVVNIYTARVVTERRQPNLFLAAVRHVGGVPRDASELREAVRAHAPRIREIMLSRSTQTNEPARCAVTGGCATRGTKPNHPSHSCDSTPPTTICTWYEAGLPHRGSHPAGTRNVVDSYPDVLQVPEPSGPVHTRYWTCNPGTGTDGTTDNVGVNVPTGSSSSGDAADTPTLLT